MSAFAVIKDAVVVNLIVADSQKIAEEVTGLECKEYSESLPADIGWIYDGTCFIAPIKE